MKTFRKLRTLFRSRQVDAEMAEEMRVHLEMLAEGKRTEGIDAEEARFAARREFGSVEQIKERCREQRGWVWVEQMAKDFRFAARSLTKAPGFTFAVVATLTIGIGATTAIVSLRGRSCFRRYPSWHPRRWW